MPSGDLDGDGTPDVIVGESCATPPVQDFRRPATLPLTLLSGRTGRPAWTAGALPMAFEAHGHSPVVWAVPRIVEPGAAADLIVRHNSPFLKASPTPPPLGAETRPHLARVSGRTGRILWDLELADRPTYDLYPSVMPFPKFEDLDGDDNLDVLLLTDRQGGGAESMFNLQAISLHDGRRLWSRTFDNPRTSYPRVVIADAGDPARPIVAIMSDLPGTADRTIGVRAFDGRDGRPRWSWSRDRDPSGAWPLIVAARQGQGGERRICVSYRAPGRRHEMVFLDGDGREARRCDWPDENPPGIADLDGDGRDELILRHDGRLRAWDADLRELWSRPTGDLGFVESIIRPAKDRPAGLLLDSGVFLDGKTGRPAWLTVGEPEPDGRGAPGSILDPGDAARPPLLIAQQFGATIARTATPATPSGASVPPGRADGDPRWTRPLPWTRPILFTIGPKGFLVVVGLALANVALPLGILRLAARRRPWTIRLLMALPIAAAVPLTVFQTFEPLVPVQIGATPASPRLVFTLLTLAGVPIVALVAKAVLDLIRHRWRAIARLTLLTVAASVLVAVAWLVFDSGHRPSYDRYDRSNWYLAGIPGTYVVGVLMVVGWPLRAAYRLLRRRSA